MGNFVLNELCSIELNGTIEGKEAVLVARSDVSVWHLYFRGGDKLKLIAPCDLLGEDGKLIPGVFEKIQEKNEKST